MSESDHDLIQAGRWQHSGQDDRRKKNRRISDDRRELIRFELDRPSRRAGKDRRRTLILT